LANPKFAQQGDVCLASIALEFDQQWPARFDICAVKLVRQSVPE